MDPCKPPDDDPGARHRFLTDHPADAVRRPLPFVSSATLSLAAHAIALVIVSIALVNKPASIPPGADAQLTTRLVYTANGPGGGGKKGGGEDAEVPARRAQLRGPDAIAVPAERAPAMNAASPVEPSQRLAIPEPAVLAGLRDAIGAITELRPVDLDSRGPGTGPGADGSKGAGIGDGDRGVHGDRTGPGSDGVDGVEPGNGVSWPRLVQEVKPNYTADAMRARVEGKVELEIVVLPDGSVGRIRLVRSLDGSYGLDQEAINAVRRWRFEPGRLVGKAVAVRVAVELSFNLR